MSDSLVGGLATIVVWVGLWGAAEMIIDYVAKDSKAVRFLIYLLITMLALTVLIWLDLPLLHI